MPERSLSLPFEIMGDWFLPENTNQRVGGTLTYKTERTELNLIDALQEIRGAFPQQEVRRYPLVYGVTEKSEAVTLIDAMQAGFTINMSSGGVRMPERLLCTTMIFGAHVTADTTYSEMRCRIPGLDIWLCSKSIEVTLRDRQIQINGLNVPDEIMGISEIDAEVIWSVRPQATHGLHAVSVDSQGWITLRPKEPRPINWYFEQLPKLSSLLTFLAGPQMPFDRIVLARGQQHSLGEVLITRFGVKYCALKSASDFFIHRSTLGDDFVKLVSRWFELYPKLQHPSGLALSVMRSDNLWPHVEFLSLMQALEGLHRVLDIGLYMTPSDYEMNRPGFAGGSNS